MKFKLFFICVLSCYIFQSCEDRITDIPVNENVLIPLSDGNYWIYIQNVNGYPGLTDTAKIAITGNIIADYEDEKYNAWFWNKYLPGSNEPLDYKWLLWNGSDGLYVMGGISSDDTLICKNLFLKFPAHVGESWDFIQIGYNLINNEFEVTDTINYRCVATNEILNTPAGDFHCYVFYWREPLGNDIVDTLLHYTYYAPNLGYVGETIKTSVDNSVKFEIFLNEYSINN